ncbi:MAG: hypothetical protein MJZ34_15285 [Paludibacteraceae bacterium]|nr:hypothetical protein [Paludibacteraceae bacterium]
MKNRFYADYRRLRKALLNDSIKACRIIESMFAKYGINISSTIEFAIENKEVLV